MKKKAESSGATNPYLNGRKEWTDRYSSIIKDKRNWQVTAIASMAVAFAAVTGLGVVASQAKTVPYVVQVDKLGAVLPVARADQAARPDATVIRYQLANFITNARTVTPDAAAMRKHVFDSYAMIDQNSAAFQVVNETMRSDDPFKRAQRESVTVAIQSVLPTAGNTWRVEWLEQVRGRDGQMVSEKPWVASVTTSINPPTDEATILRNPLGLYVNAVSWSPRV